MLTPYARLLGTTVRGLWQLAAVSDDGTIPLPGELVLDSGSGYIGLSRPQEGLSCRGPSPRHEVRWPTEPRLAVGRAADAEEWLDLVAVEKRPALPLSVTTVTGWFAADPCRTPLGLALSGTGEPLVFMATEGFDLVCTDRMTARTHAEQTTTVMRVRLIERELRL